MKTYNIGVIGGDGIGPEVVREGLKVLQVVKEGFDYNFIEYPYSSEHYLKTKELVPDKVIDEWRTLDAVFLGAIAEMVFTRRGTERIIRYAFELARERAKVRGASGRKPKLTMVDKANAIRAQDLWTRVFEEVGREYPDVEQDHAYVDACCMWMVKNPDWFDVIVTTNLFGDIITDLGAMIQGGMGIAASGNIHPGKHGMFE